MGALIGILILALGLLGTPLFAVMGGASELLWLTHDSPGLRFVRFLAPNILDDRFAGSPVLVTIPLFTFVGYLMAESKTPDRIVRASAAFFGWMPGGLAMVCIVASAVFTLLTGGSGVTIVAIGGLLYPALRRQGYPADYALGLVTTGGSLGLLLPYSLPILVYALVSGISWNSAAKAVILPGLLILALLGAHAAYVGTKHRVPRSRPDVREMAAALWLMKWELGIAVLLVGGVGSGLASIDEVAALTALYTLCIEVFLYGDLDLKKDIPRVAKNSMSLAGAIIIILAMANALINYVIDQRIPLRVLDYMLSLGLSHTWQFLIVLNLFLLALGMLMEGFSAILVAVPLILPFAARFNLHPFHLAIMFLLNLEIAFCTPPLGLNLFIASFRFERPLTSLYRLVMPFVAILGFGLVLIMYVPKISTTLVDADIQREYEKAAQHKEAPREAWLLQCVQEDRSNPVPCTAEDREKYGPDGRKNPFDPALDPAAAPPAQPDADAGAAATDDEELLRQMLSSGAGGEAPKPAPTSSVDADEELLREMMGDKK